MSFKRFVPICVLALGCGVYGFQQINRSPIMAASPKNLEIQNKRL